MLDLFLKPQKILETLAAYQEIYQSENYVAIAIITANILLSLFIFVMLGMKIFYAGLNERKKYKKGGNDKKRKKKKAEKSAKKKSKKKKGKKKRRR